MNSERDKETRTHALVLIMHTVHTAVDETAEAVQGRPDQLSGCRALDPLLH